MYVKLNVMEASIFRNPIERRTAVVENKNKKTPHKQKQKQNEKNYSKTYF